MREIDESFVMQAFIGFSLEMCEIDLIHTLFV